jgi:hypothetical protein
MRLNHEASTLVDFRFDGFEPKGVQSLLHLKADLNPSLHIHRIKARHAMETQTNLPHRRLRRSVTDSHIGNAYYHARGPPTGVNNGAAPFVPAPSWKSLGLPSDQHFLYRNQAGHVAGLIR